MIPDESIKKKHFTIPIFIPHASCPYQCVFCNQKYISGQMLIPTENEIEVIINKHLASIPKNNTIIEIGFFGGSFTAIPIEKQKLFLEVASKYIKNGSISEIRISTRPDFINNSILKTLKDYGVKTIELGAQSMDEEVIANSGRGHSVQDIVSASKLIKNEKFKLGLQMMIGLPFDTLEKSIYTANQIINLKADCTRIYPTLVIKNTILAILYKENKYKPLTLEEAIEWTKELLLIFKNSNTKVIRVGLHPSEGLLNGESLVAGPFHQSFMQLVMTKIWQNLLNKIVNVSNFKKVVIYVSKEQFNYAIGYNSLNKLNFQKIFPYVAFKIDDNLIGFNYYVDFN